ncbi:MAG: hypothetical protein JO022_13540 [Acidobacteriaceae bacterium]|nr:hypothetical protein [Acidobacteriaceae bacterium]
MRWLVLLATLTTTLSAADITGFWLGKMPTRKDDYQELAFRFTQNGSVLTGKMYGDYNSTPISEGVVSGDSITFIVNLHEQAGNQINETRVRFTGKVTGDEIELVRERESSLNAGNGGAVQMKNNAKQSCHLKLLARP